MDREDRRELLRGNGIPTFAADVLERLGSLSRQAGRKTKEEHPRELLAREPRRRHSLADERGGESALVYDHASRTGPRLLFHGLYAARSAAAVAHRCQPGVSRRDG